ncbi:3306_t:CDS:1 [Funneliformis geosporum]|uniref:3306_t:CDS:1 n=1 Tax=Funneliformis geosporum TaxID=1117311 RepID=A0A9W4SC48_9GLOM|nr:3306_t:CDS:1 [Funneliformis geosporum]
MGQLSKLASCYCDNEPENVKEFYRKLSEDAKSLYKQTKQNEIQILFDKNMNELEEIRENPVENIIYTQNSTSGFEDNSASLDSHNFINSFQPNFPNSTFFEYPYRMNEVTNDQEFIRMLEYESVQFTPLQVDTDYLNYTQGIKDPVENIIYTQTSTPGFENNSASLMNLMNSFLDSRNFISSFQTSFPNSNFFENPYRMNEVANDQEYIRMLECENVQFSPLQVEVPIEDIIVSTCGAASDCINYPVENENMFLPSL